MNPIFSAYAQSDLFGKGIFLSLLALSILTWALWIYKWRHLRRASETASKFQILFASHQHAPLALTPQSQGPFEQLYESFKRSALEILHKNRALSEQTTLTSADIGHVENQILTQLSVLNRSYEKNLFVFSTVVTLAPFLGLLGTVWGILLTFAELQHGGSVSANTTIMGGLAMALGTTVVGLLVAIPALLAYNGLRNRASYFHQEMEDFASELLGTLELHYRKVEE